jgi:hypothetical protein
MHPHHAPFFRFREITDSLPRLPERAQIFVLKLEADRRGRTLQRALDRERDSPSTVSGEPDARSAELARQLEDTTRELESTQARSQRQVCALRLEILSMETQCQTLDTLCRSLLLTIEHAAESEAHALSAPTASAGEHRVSA